MEVGYRHNPLAGALMSEMRRSRTGTFRGVIAVLDLDGASARPSHVARYHRDLAAGATERADGLGFKAEPFVIGQAGISANRLDTILQSRGIRGVLLQPVSESPDLSRLDWSRLAGVYADYFIERPALHCVCADHHRSMITALQRLHAMGYKRPGLVLEQHRDERLLHRWEAAFRAYQDHHGVFAGIAPFIVPEVTHSEFVPWFKSNKPDVVVAHQAEIVTWMAECGARVPDTHGFCCLNIVTACVPCAGINLQPRVLGARGVELLIGQLLRNEYGVPDQASTTTIPGLWTDGPTLRVMGKPD
jgi:LacI family transcriptional regulator